MNVVEMLTALKRVACIINSCPLAAKDKRGLVMGALGSGQEPDSSHPDYLEPITANSLLIGRSGRDPIDRDYEFDCGPRKRLAFIRHMEEDWWEQYKLECFEYLLPTDKWRASSDNLEVGDIVLIKYEGKSSPGDYRWGIVTSAEPDEDGLVRTVEVRYSLVKRPVQGGDYTGITRKSITVAVQRLSRIYSRKEQEVDGISPDMSHNSTKPPLNIPNSRSLSTSTFPLSPQKHSHSSHSNHGVAKPTLISGMMRSMLHSCHQYEARLRQELTRDTV